METTTTTPRFYCRVLRCTNPAAADIEITCPVCGRAYPRCSNHDGAAGARRSLRSHMGLYGHTEKPVAVPGKHLASCVRFSGYAGTEHNCSCGAA